MYFLNGFALAFALLLLIAINGCQCNNHDFKLSTNRYTKRNELVNDVNCGVSSVADKSKLFRIIGGREATRGRWPWQVIILNRLREPFCGGTLISPQFVLTAAHCVRKRLVVRGGEHDLLSDEDTEQDVTVSEAFVHPNYDSETVDNDIALLKLRRPLKINKYLSTVCLPKSSDQIKPKSTATILGWGKQRNSAIFGTDVLHQANVPTVDMDKCRAVYRDYFISDNMICAGYERGKVDSCAGDSGGPLLIKKGKKWFVFGITSFGDGCGRKGKYGIYAKVANYVKWIRRTIRKSMRKQKWRSLNWN